MNVQNEDSELREKYFSVFVNVSVQFWPMSHQKD